MATSGAENAGTRESPSTPAWIEPPSPASPAVVLYLPGQMTQVHQPRHAPPHTLTLTLTLTLTHPTPATCAHARGNVGGVQSWASLAVLLGHPGPASGSSTRETKCGKKQSRACIQVEELDRAAIRHPGVGGRPDHRAPHAGVPEGERGKKGRANRAQQLHRSASTNSIRMGAK